MVSKFLILSVLLFIYIASVFATCKKDCNKEDYAFELKIRAYPDRDSIHIGDTVWFEIDESTLLVDRLSNRQVAFSRAKNLGTVVGFEEVVGSAPQLISSANDFNYSIKKGNETANINPQRFRQYLFAEENGRYLFKLAVVPQRTGVFRIVISNASNVFSETVKCAKGSFEINFFNTNQHFYFYPGGANTPLGGGTYYFKVY